MPPIVFPHTSYTALRRATSASLCAALTLVLIAATTALPAQAAPPKQPNVIIFLADDLGWADVGYHGEEVIETPSIDRIAREGVELDRFYSTPICSPTRAALMTGRDPMRLGVAYGVIMPWMSNGVPLGSRLALLPRKHPQLLIS